MHLGPRLLLKRIQAILLLDDSGLLHQELELAEGRVGLVPTPVALDLDCGQDWSIRSLKPMHRVVHGVLHVRPISEE